MSEFNEYQLKHQLKDTIAGREVKAALFYTFNFSPRFFENYIMPLLVPFQRFINNEIANHIVWRNLYKEGRVPPITVYFDHDAKDADSGPMLDYHFVAVRMPNVGRNKGNFHPKNSFILVQNGRGEEELIVLTGSNNITQNGWCENLECVAQTVLNPLHYYPESLCKSFREFVNETAAAFGQKYLTTAEELILKSLNRYGATNQSAPALYHSLSDYKSFEEFLEEQVFNRFDIHLMEIQSPYFSHERHVLASMLKRGFKIRIEAPLRSGVVMMDKSLFESYTEKGVIWYRPSDEQRNLHRKVYRLHARDRIFTIIGSVNFTQPAWKGFEKNPKSIFNIESALLFEQKISTPTYLLGKPLKKDEYRFDESLHVDEIRFERPVTPDIQFEMDWSTRTLHWNNKSITDCMLCIPGEPTRDIPGKGKYTFPNNKHGDTVLDTIARKPLLTVLEQDGDEQREHLYYMSQTGFGLRPSHFRLTPADMVDAWELLGKDDEISREWFETTLERLADLIQDESGRVDMSRVRSKSLLNDMARQFYGLSQLEDFLFDDKQMKGSDKSRGRHLMKISYYLTNDNIDTLINYVRGLEKLHEQGGLMNSYYWLLLQIIRTRFYLHPRLKSFMKASSALMGSEVRMIQITAESRLTHIQSLIEQVEMKLDVKKSMLEWTLKNLEPANA
jgi:hypothetical protein